jgi:hypothetical protein
MSCRLAGAAVALLVVLRVGAADKKAVHTIKTVADASAPEELAAPVRDLLDNRCVQLRDAKGYLRLEVWLRKEVPVKATEAQVKNGLTYQEVPASTLLGAVRVTEEAADYRKQQVPAGVYTLRLAFQPVSDDHVGTAPSREFALLSPAEHDTKPDLLEAKVLIKLSTRTTNNHPAVLVLFRGKGAGATPKLVAKEGGHRVLLLTLPARAGKVKGTLPLGLTLIGASPKA